MSTVIERILSEVGNKVVDEILDKSAQELSNKNGLKVSENKSDLIVGFKVKGNPNIFFDFFAINSYVRKESPLIEDDIAIVVVYISDPRMRRYRFMRVRNSDIVGVYKFNVKMVKPAVWESLNKSDISEEKERQVISEKVEYKAEDKKETLNNNFDLKENSFTAKVDVSAGTMTDEIIEIPKEDETPLIENSDKTFLGRVTRKGVNAVTEMTQNISELAETVDRFKGKVSLKIIHEVCDTNTSLEAFEGELKGTHRVVSANQGTIEILHVYKNGRYIGSYHKADLFALIAPMVAEKKVEIEKIKHIKTIRGEFQPKDKF